MELRAQSSLLKKIFISRLQGGGQEQQTLNNMDVVEHTGWHGVTPYPGGHFPAHKKRVACLRREERDWCPLMPSAGMVRPVRMGDLPWGGRPCMRVYGLPGRSGRGRMLLWSVGLLVLAVLLGGVYVCG